MTAGTAQVHVRHRRFVLAKLGNRAHRPTLVREKRALAERASNGANDFARDINRRMGDTLQNFWLQVGNVIRGNEIDEVIGVRFACFIPGACRNSAGRIASDDVRHTQHHEFHQRLAGRRATGIYRGIVPTDDHWRRRQHSTATL